MKMAQVIATNSLRLHLENTDRRINSGKRVSRPLIYMPLCFGIHLEALAEERVIDSGSELSMMPCY